MIRHHAAQGGIELDELPAHMRALANDMQRVGAAILEGQSAPILRALAAEMEKRRGGRA